jgi:hypothetical protein
LVVKGEDADGEVGGNNLHSLLARLPSASVVDAESRLKGLLLPGPAASVRLAVRDLIFEINSFDILGVRPCSGDDVLVGTVELSLTEKAIIRRVYPARPFREFLRGRRPFAFSTRDGSAVQSVSSARYNEREREYLLRRGLFAAP